MFKKQAAVFLQYFDKKRAASFVNGFKIFRKKRVSWESKQRFKLCGENISIQEKQAMPYQHSFRILTRSVLLGYKAYAVTFCIGVLRGC